MEDWIYKSLVKVFKENYKGDAQPHAMVQAGSHLAEWKLRRTC